MTEIEHGNEAAQATESLQQTGAQDLKQIYEDADYFITGIIEEYGFYGKFIESMRSGGGSLRINRKTIHKEIEANWVRAIEDGMQSVDYSMRHYGSGIKEREEILPIEFSRNINNRSIRHLAQHTEFISDIDGDNITPSKILNVFNEENLQTYENRFLNTLIQRLYIFIDRRYRALREHGLDETSVALEYVGNFRLGSTDGVIRFSVEANDAAASGQTPMLDRVKNLYDTITRCMGSPFVKAMGNGYIRPPVMRTNAIMKNKHLRACLELWDFIESYEKVGYALSVVENAEEPDEKTIQDLYSILSLQYMVFHYHIHQGETETGRVVNTRTTERPLKPRLITELKAAKEEDYNIYETEYRRVVNVSKQGGQHRLTRDEIKIRKVVDTALNACRQIELLSAKTEKAQRKK